MSLLICLRGTDGLVLATDSRGTFGDPRGVTAQNDQIKKVYLASKHVGVLVAGAGDLGSTVVSGFLALPDISTLGVTEFTVALHHYAREQFREWFDLFSTKKMENDPRPARPDLNFIVAGFELNHDPRIYRMSSGLDFAPLLHNYGFGVDGVAQYALYLLNRLYDPKATVGNLEVLAAYLIAETASQDGKVGGAIQMLTMTPYDSRVLAVTAVEAIVLRNKERNRALKRSFMGGGDELTGSQLVPADTVESDQASDPMSSIPATTTSMSDGLNADFLRDIQW